MCIPACASVSCPIGLDLVVFLEDVHEVVDVFFSNVFTPKSSTTSVNYIGLVMCFHSPGTSLLWKYPCLLRRCLRSLSARSSACGNRYKPFVTYMYTIPTLLTFLCTCLYSLMISSGRSLIFTWMYSSHLSGVMR